MRTHHAPFPPYRKVETETLGPSASQNVPWQKQKESNLKSEELEKRLDALAKQNTVLMDNCLDLVTSNEVLKCEIEN